MAQRTLALACVVLLALGATLVAAAPTAAATSCEVLEDPVDGATCVVVDTVCMFTGAIKEDWCPL